ncbi:hypothetical protein QG37_05761 [Candidozyma auris]|nr:hypothetical protein QG37_05761 [[Candida] auris]
MVQHCVALQTCSSFLGYLAAKLGNWVNFLKALAEERNKQLQYKVDSRISYDLRMEQQLSCVKTFFTSRFSPIPFLV